MASMTAIYDASRPITSDAPEAVAAAVREATGELRETLQRHGIDASFDELALLGHSESWDADGQRWVHVSWDGEGTGQPGPPV